MRIRSLHIGSFGKIREKDFELAPGLTVFYGPNESGKTTAMEFIRSTLSPKRGASYPERSKTDSGTIVYEEGGAEKRVMMEGKTGNTGEVPGCMADLEPATYRSIFAMNREGLDEISPLTGGDIRTRFLTIPGGESVPDVIEGIDCDRDRLIGKTASSPSDIISICNTESALEAKIQEMRSRAATYSDLSAEKERLEKRLSEIRESNRLAESRNDLYAKVESQRPAYIELEGLRKKRDAMSSGQMAGREAEETYRRLSDKSNEAEAAYRAVNEGRNRQISSLPGGDESKLLGCGPRIRSILERQPRYLSEISKPPTRTVTKSRGRTRMGVAAMLFVVAAAVWIVPGLDSMIRIGISAAAAFCAIAALLLIKDERIPMAGRDEGWIGSYEAEVDSVVSDLGIAPGSIQSNLKLLSDISGTLASLDSSRSNCSNLKIASLEAEAELKGFLSQYGGPDGYRQAAANYRESCDCNSSIHTLERTIRESGFDPDEPLPTAERVDIDVAEQNAVSQEIGRLASEMGNVLDTRELDALIDRASSLRAQKIKVLTEGATAILASAIMQKACSDIYETVHPDVINTADRYLSMMTLGTCRFDLDPRNTDLTVISNGEPKGPKQWSTGLRAQILLSVKLAVAKEMGGGEIPVILDDVLLPFDADRKSGACQALSALAEEMQVLLFTCDGDVARICRAIPNVSIITMRPTMEPFSLNTCSKMSLQGENNPSLIQYHDHHSP